MDARELLEQIEARGGVATIRREGEAAKINVAPKALALELLSDLQRFKPSLLKLLAQRERKRPTRAQQIEAAHARLALGPSPTWRQLKPIFAVAHAAPDFAVDFKLENLVEWSRALCVQEQEERTP